jgi:hypothetical protein
MSRAMLVVAVLNILSVISVYAEDYICKDVGSSWVWFSDHVATSVEYKVIGETGNPLGWREKYTEMAEFSAWGLGAVHIRAIDGGEPFKVCLATGGISPITIYKKEF